MLDDVFLFRHADKQMQRLPQDAPQKLFTYQMPVLFDKAKKSVLAVDWKTKQTVVFGQDKRWDKLRELL